MLTAVQHKLHSGPKPCAQANTAAIEVGAVPVVDEVLGVGLHLRNSDVELLSPVRMIESLLGDDGNRPEAFLLALLQWQKRAVGEAR